MIDERNVSCFCIKSDNGNNKLIYQWVTHSDGSRHIRCECAHCGKSLGCVTRTTNNIKMAIPEKIVVQRPEIDLFPD